MSLPTVTIRRDVLTRLQTMLNTRRILYEGTLKDVGTDAAQAIVRDRLRQADDDAAHVAMCLDQGVNQEPE